MNRQLLTIAGYTLIEAVRNRLFWLLLVVLCCAFGIVEFLGGLALTESSGIRSAMFAGFLRMFSVFMVCLFVTTSMAREIQDKGMQFFLAFPLSRASYFFGKLAGYALLSVITALVMGLCTSLYAPFEQSVLWSLSLLMELLLIASFSLLCVFTFSQVTVAVVAVMAFYLLSRSVEAIRLIGSGPTLDPGSLPQQLMGTIIEAIAYVLPDLSQYTLSEWLVYQSGEWQLISPLVFQTVIYLLLISSAGLFDLYRKSL